MIIGSCLPCKCKTDVLKTETDSRECAHDPSLQVRDIIGTLYAAKNAFLPKGSTLSNVHLFLDEVNDLNDDWTELDQIAKNCKNVIWLGLDSEYKNEIEARLNLKYFERHQLNFVLRNSKLITRLCNKIREYYWKYSGITPLTGSWPEEREWSRYSRRVCEELAVP